MFVVGILAGGVAACNPGLDGDSEIQGLFRLFFHLVHYVSPYLVNVLLAVIGEFQGKLLIQGNEACLYALSP